MKEEKKKQIEQKFAQIDEKTEKVRASGWWAAALWAGLHPRWAPSRSDSGGRGFRGEQAGLAGAGGAGFCARPAGLSEEGCALTDASGWALQAKEERLAEEKAKKKAAAKKMEEVEARRKQEEEARRLRRLQQV